ncbi:unnamed protein product [Caenorhabditis angaria]|uniref:Nose resistant-to-fluoxetine protein N-terminal domain-containing protein n=1 Tax=Caenorhabditis angaria TaxID=860376 RepID=A0A9P1IVZ4_9PELO|nr:unnamed protein product [Caenorhabditis angaria]
MRVSLNLLVFFLSFLTIEIESIDFDPAKAIDLLNDLIEHPREVIDQLQQYKISDLIGALGFHSNANFTISKQCHDELTFLGYGMIDSAQHVHHGSFENRTRFMTAEERQYYLIPMMDSAGKVGSGISRGHITASGQFRQCKNVRIYSTTLNRTLRGDYYRVLFDLKMRANSANGSCQVPQIGLDLCLPYVCKNDNLTDYFREGGFIGFSCQNNDTKNLALGSSIEKSPVCSVINVNQRVPKPNIYTFFVSGVLISIVILCIIAGFVDYFHARKFAKSEYKRIDDNSSTLWKMFMSFSLYRNVKNIFRIKNCNRSGQVTSLNCIRTISTVWVIFGHCSAIMVLVCTNPMDLIDYTKTYIGLFMANAYYAVDTFFFISAFLLTFLWFKELKKRRAAVMSPMGWIMFYVHRILRLTPVYYITIFFFTFVFTRLLRDAPVYMSPAVQDDTCERNFWLNLLYIDNIIDSKHICYVISWYLATDIQIYCLTPLLLLPFALGGKIAGLIACATVFLGSTAYNTYQMLVWHFPPTQFQFGPKDPRYNPDERRYDQWNYYNPLNSMSNLYYGNDGNLWTPIENAVYSSLGRILWGLSLSWIIFSTYYRKGMINDFMSLPIWTPLARMSFCAYLIHIMVCGYFFGKNYSEMYFSSQFFLEAVIPVTVLSFVIAIFWSSFFEIPFAKLEMLLFGGSSRRKRTPIAPSTMINEIQGIHKIPVNIPEDILQKPLRF